jgi:putative peptide maturation dehydrogenase
VTKVRRTVYACFYVEDDYELDLAKLLSGQPEEPTSEATILALVVLTGERHRLSRDAFELLLSVPASRWVDSDGRNADLVQSLTDKGLLLSDADDQQLGALRERDEALAGNEWNLYAALYHYMTQWSGVELSEGHEEAVQLKAQSKAAARAFVAEHGVPPDAFADSRSTDETRLPGRERDGALFRALTSRTTTRSFDQDESMTVDELDSVLRYVFGSHGYGRNSADVLCIKRTSPSGGGLHPVEAYPIISNVEGVAPGLYHYSVRNHSLVMLSELEPTQAREMATWFMCGQRYFGDSHVSFILTARFYRNHWKYRRHQKAYAGILMDAAHLSQTLYLVTSELNLGAFVTMAVNARDIEERLGIDGVSEGVIAMTGCGRRAPGDSPLEMQFFSDIPHA